MVSIPKRERMLLNSWIVAPNTALEQTTWSPLLRCVITVVRMADMPEAVATQVSSIQMGRYLTAGMAVFSIVSSEKLWIDANPKETDLTYVRAGQAVAITVDAFPDRHWEGTVGAISPGTGAQFAILPPQNAAGNWIKVVQRVPMRIEFAPGQDLRRLRAGMSANVEIDTGRPGRLAGLLGGSAVAHQGRDPHDREPQDHP